jgi:hypothetical protein
VSALGIKGLPIYLDPVCLEVSSAARAQTRGWSTYRNHQPGPPDDDKLFLQQLLVLTEMAGDRHLSENNPPTGLRSGPLLKCVDLEIIVATTLSAYR